MREKSDISIPDSNSYRDYILLNLVQIMNLAIDLGNTRVKAGLFNGRELVETRVYDSPDALAADSSFYKKAEKCMVGSVVKDPQYISGIFSDLNGLRFFNTESKIPLKNSYKSVATLGSDRLAASIGAYSIYPNRNVLVIDSGTCLKFNFTTANNEYLGGAISPGIKIRFKALQHFTDKLPLVNFDENFEKLIGQNTEESILSGVINGILNETDGVINQYKASYPDLTIVVTGGDTGFFAKRLKNCIFAQPHLVLNGLNEILICNS
jgi:type III pantothenate kinase